MFVTRVVAGIVAFLALLVACSNPPEPTAAPPPATPDTAATVEALVATQVAETIPLAPLTDAYAYYNRGYSYRNLGQQEQADRDFAKAKELGVE